MRGFIFDLDGCVWTGDVLIPGAADVLALLRGQGRALTFLTNNSRARAATMQAKLERLGIQAAVNEVLTPLEILGRVLDTHVGAASRVLAIGGPELEAAVVDGGHTLVPMDRYREAQAVVVGKPEPPLFELALARMGLTAEDAAMVGDSVDSDIRGARRVGLTAVFLAPKGGLDGVAHYMVKSMSQLRRLLETYTP